MKNLIALSLLSIAASIPAYGAGFGLDWIDPVKEVAPGCRFVMYPTPQRGEGTYGSCMVYVPDQYYANPSSLLPVVYYLHGGTGNQREAEWMIARIDKAIKAGEMKPVIVVSPQALPIGWYINANTADPKVTSGPIADVMMKDLIPYIDSHFRTVASADGRGIEGFSMGGRGAMMLAFRHPDMFGAVSSVAGALVNWDEEPLQRALECTFGDVSNPFSQTYFEAWHPKSFAISNARDIKGSGMKVRMFVGDKDRLYEENGTHITGRFHNMLDTLGIAHTFEIAPGANHNPKEIFGEGALVYDPVYWTSSLSSGSLPVQNVPDTITSFVKSNFGDTRISRIDIEEDPRGPQYNILLDNDMLLRMNENFKWILADATSSAAPYPASLAHDGIAYYLATHQPEVAIKRIAKVPRVGYEVLLSDGQTLTFDTAGIIIKKR